MKSANRRDALTIASLAAVGIVLGALAAPLFAPVPKAPVTEPVLPSGRTHLSAPDDSRVWIEPGPDDLAIFPGSYPPTDDYDGEIWQYPAPTYEPWEPEPTFALDEAEVSEIGGALEAAEEAEKAAKDAAAATTAQQVETVRKSTLANGLY